jgi:hypothetical protein
MTTCVFGIDAPIDWPLGTSPFRTGRPKQKGAADCAIELTTDTSNLPVAGLLIGAGALVTFAGWPGESVAPSGALAGAALAEPLLGPVAPAPLLAGAAAGVSTELSPPDAQAAINGTVAPLLTATYFRKCRRATRPTDCADSIGGRLATTAPAIDSSASAGLPGQDHDRRRSAIVVTKFTNISPTRTERSSTR